jgi:hypothetical protein
MGWGKDDWRAGLRGAGCGMLGGLAVTCLYYLYEQWVDPSPYNGLMAVIYAPVLAILGGVVGLLAAAWYTSD